ncbi:MAG TPA: hypothetical protein VMT94_06040, partial [Burkholderiales bacterium]|nr:hypothetical protein [Burkholderiales bacterium]
MRFARRCLVCTLLAAAHAYAQTPDQPVVTFLATDPAPDARLARNERFYVRFEVKSTAPVTVMINACTDGNPVFADMGSSAVTRLAAGDHTAVAHFFYWGAAPRRIDGIRLTVGAADNPGKGVDFTLPVNLTLTARDAVTPRVPAPWALEQQSRSAAPPKPDLAAAGNDGRNRMLMAGIVLLAAACAALYFLRLRLPRARNK